jgi:hypothetical protein
VLTRQKAAAHLVGSIMQIDPKELAADYARMGEIELLELAQSYELLTDTAQAALREEFARRKLEPPILQEREQVQHRALVTIRRYRDLSEAIVARSMLESAGIYVFLSDENLVRLDWQVSNFVGGIRLQVEGSDEQAALDILSQSIPTYIPFDGDDEFVQPRCPRCASTDITFEGASRGAALASLSVLAIPLPLGRETWLCHACEARWEDTDDDAD